MQSYKYEKVKNSAFILFFVLLANCVNAQNKYTISGTIKDKATGEELLGAVVKIEELKNTAVVTNNYGYYSITLPEGDYTVSFIYTGYKNQSIKVALRQSVKLDIAGEEEVRETEEVVITSEKKDQNITQAQMGMEKLDIKNISKIPVLFGEKDILKTLQLLPGIKSAGDGNSGFYVRGGAADQNLILLDEAPVYNASHLLGFFSTFNSDALKDVAVYKGNAPAQYGGRLSSVLDVKMKDGNDKKFGATGGIGLIASRLSLEGPLVKDKGSFLISARRTYADAFLKLSSNQTTKNSTLYFYDINVKANYKLNEKNRIFLSGYFGRDKIGLGSTFGIDWGNTTGTLRWNHLINNRWFSNTSLIVSNYSYKISINNNNNDFKILSKIRDYNIKQEFQYFPNPRNNIRIGFNSIFHTVTPGQITASAGINATQLQERYGWENAVYITNEWKATERINVTYGLRATNFSALGSGNFYTYDKNGAVTDTTSYKSGQIVQNYLNLEPRLSASYVLNTQSSIKASYSRNVQNLHLISNSTTSSPTDLWIMSSKNVKAEIADQVSAGYYRNFKDNMFEFSAEVYYKALQNQIDYKDGANTQANDKLEGQLLFGKGRAYGIELLVKKKVGRLNGWVGYTLSKTERQIDGINNGNWYNARQDRRHDISVVLIYDLTKKWSISSTWVYYTGNAVTFPSGKYVVDGKTQFLYTERNGYRMPAYHRLDLAATWVVKKTEKRESSWSFSLYNAYGRQNAYTITFQQSTSDPNKTEAVQTSLFRWVPSITYNFKF
jgi:hypothetical protein